MSDPAEALPAEPHGIVTCSNDAEPHSLNGECVDPVPAVWTPGAGMALLRKEHPEMVPELTQEDIAAADRLIAHAQRSRGICGAFAPMLAEGPTPICTLMAEHPGWHGDREGMSWVERSPEVPDDLPPRTFTKADVGAAYERGKAEQAEALAKAQRVADSLGRRLSVRFEEIEKLRAEVERLTLLLEQADAIAEQIHARGIAEGRRQAAEGWEREWGARWMQDAADPTDVLHPCGGEDAAREMERRSGGYRRAESRLVGPWEPDEQPDGGA